MMRPSITSFSWVWGWFELVSLRSCLLGSSSRSLLLHPIHKSIIRFALLLFGLPAQFLRASPGGILFQRSLRFSNAGKAGFTASELRWDVLFSLFNAQPLVFLLVDRARSLQQFFDLERQPLLLLGHPLVGHRLVLARVRLHLRAIECDVSEPHQTCFLAKLQDFDQVQASKSIRPTIDSRRNDLQELLLVKWTSYRKLACMVTLDHEKLEVYQLAVEYADIAEEIAQELQPGHAHVRDQLRRASDSIVNNTAEDRARGSATRYTLLAPVRRIGLVGVRQRLEALEPAGHLGR